MPAPDLSRRVALEHWGPALLVNAWLTRAIALLVLLLLGAGVVIVLQARALSGRVPLLVGIDAAGRAQALAPTTLLRDSLLPEERVRVYRHALSQFVTRHYSRRRATIARDYPESLLFLTQPLADPLLRPAGTDPIKTFIRDQTAPEVDVVVTQVTFPNLSAAPYAAAVDYTATDVPARGAPARAFTAQITFQVRDSIPNELIPINPLGVEILQLRTDQAFR